MVTSSAIPNVKVECKNSSVYFSFVSGIIEEIHEDELVVNFLSKSGKSFFWPQTCDRQKLKFTGVLSKLEFCPEPVSSRLFKLPNHDEIDALFEALV